MHFKSLLAPTVLLSLVAAQNNQNVISVDEKIAKATSKHCNPFTPEALDEFCKSMPASQMPDIMNHLKELPMCSHPITKEELQNNLNSSISPKLQANTWHSMITQPARNQCGKLFNNQNCEHADKDGGPCCSVFGWCGFGPSYCGDGCQASFSTSGQCDHEQSPPKDHTPSGKPKHDKPKNIDTNKKGHVITLHESSEGGRCGEKYQAVCAPGLCCSGGGYCGKTGEYCGVPGNCQEKYGWCDSFVVPKGYDISKDKRKYDDRLPARINKCTRPGSLALTFDDGPSQYTEQVLDVLKEFNARATFFLGGNLNGRGSIDQSWAKVVRRMITEGHQVGSHTWSHPDLNALSSADRKAEMHKNERAIANVIGKYPTFVRAPMIKCNDGCMKDMKSLGYHVVDWQFDSQDWKENRPSADSVVNSLKNGMNDQDGNMFVIQHDTHADAAKVARGILENKRSDWQAIPLVECLGSQHEDAYRFPHYLEYSKAAADGCLLAGHDFCYQAQPFSNIDGCKDAVKKLADAHQKCLKSSPQLCKKVARVHEQLEDYCKNCGKSKSPSCDWTRFIAEL